MTDEPANLLRSMSDRQSETLAIERRGQVLLVTLDREEAANARNQVMRDELAALWRAVADDASTAAVVLTGSGNRHFCAGMDLKEAGRPEGAADRRDRMRASRDIEALAALPQPTIAAINGYALGGGFEMALACDLRIVAGNAVMALPEVGIGLVPGGGATQRLPGLIGSTRAAELVLTGRQLSATDAVDWGIANAQYAGSELIRGALELATKIGDQPRRAMIYAKQLLRLGGNAPHGVGLDAELDALCLLLAQRVATSEL